MLAQTLPKISQHMTFNNPLAQVWPRSAPPDSAEDWGNPARGLSQLVVMDKASLFWEGKEMESGQMDTNQAVSLALTASTPCGSGISWVRAGVFFGV